MTDSLLVILLLFSFAGCVYCAWRWQDAAKRLSEQAVASGEVRARLEQIDAVTKERDGLRARAETLSAELAGERAAGEARVKAAIEKEEALRSLHVDMEKKFVALAQQALAQNETQFLNLANETFEKHKTAAAGGVKEVVGPVQEQFAKLSEKIEALDKTHTADKAALHEQMRLVGENLSSANKTTSDLVNALRNAPKTRGRWGEEALKNVLQLSGLTPGVDFHEQAAHQGDDGRILPDFIIRLPGERCIIVDSKVPLSGYLDAMNATTDEARDACLKKHASELRTHMMQLGSKDYWRHVPSSADYVIMFVPGDNFIAAAFERDQDLYQDGFAKRVIVLGPSNLFALAKTIAFGWRQEEVQKNADEIAKLGRDLYSRLAKLSQLVGGVGSSIEKSVKSYNELVSSLDSRVMVTARKFKELGAAEGAEPVEPAQVDTMPRLPAPQLDFELTPPVIEQRRRLGKL